VTASDLSTGEIDRAKEEAEKRKLNITFSVCDMQKAFEHHAAQFDVVISCDNSVPHLLTDDHILTAFKQFYECTRPGGGCIITVRDYEKEDLSVQQIKPYGIREKRGVRWLAWQVWDPHPPTYDVTMYMIEDRGESDCQTHVMRSVYYAVGIPTLMRLMGEAGFTRIRRQDKGFFQPVIMGERDE
jgi:cyclopropane fatty-acyl-phospholipid synthase-like methyltransferase